MSTENDGHEGTAQPAAPSAPPVPAAAPQGPPPPPAPPAAPAPPAPPAPPAYGDQDTTRVQDAAQAQGETQAPAQATTPEQQPAAYGQAAPHGQPAAYGQDTAYGQSSGHGYDTAAGHAQAGAWPPPPHTAAPGSGDGTAWGAPVQPGAKPPRKRPGALAAAVLVAALVAGAVGGAAGFWAGGREDGPDDSTTVTASEIPKDLKREPGTVAAVAAKALPSVVTIEAKSGGGEGSGDIGGRPDSGTGTGTGFVYDKQGHILTNNHVVATAAENGTLSATFSNGKTYDAEVVGRAQGYDVAVLKLKNAPAGLTPLAIGDSEKVAVGDSTIAIGAPFGLSNTVTTGIISAKNRPVASGDGSSGKNSYMSALQTDASINPGNSGGPLLDSRGSVIGINSAIQSTGGGLGQSQAGSIGLGFAIPINQAKNVAEQLIKDGKPVYPVIGATVDMTETTNGAKIAADGTNGTPAVPPNGPAAKAGLKSGDIITKLNDKPIDSGPTLISEIWNHKPGDQITLTYERDGKESTTPVTLGSRTGDS
ncbi:trypsin-like peptidase domain-containing protein [Streptomyces sp. NPDC047315]|uniref:S1C family serine protease n=1 Tax=Streptomyces sp. NPDC047315 TaxID=3155142 RepID=UPI0033C7BFB8